MLNNLMDGTIYGMCINVNPYPCMAATPFLQSAHRSETHTMGKRIQLQESANFGERLAQLRKAAGYTQVELAQDLGISQRMVAYYESPNASPPANLLPKIAAALGVTIDELFGKPAKRRLAKQDGDSRLRRRLLAIEKLDLTERRQVLQLLDAFIERGQLKRKAESRTGG
ncbi:MAG: helix-turn-helix transcriptional regulator [Burkholderiales bacterium]|nr:helix-turn-helix transcriptional regulator [Burkholderiales bacterium]